MKFIDYVTIDVQAGNGGNGCIAFLREKFRPKGGPSGGDGGNGGSVFLKVDSNLATLSDLIYKKHYRGEKGQNGMGKNMHGKNGSNILDLIDIVSHENSEYEFFIPFGVTDSAQVRLLAVDIFGQSADMDKINVIAKKHGLKVISDTAQAPGALYHGKLAGTLGTIGGFSFNYHKHIHTGEGGMIVCKTKEDYELIHTLRSHGWDRGLNLKTKKNDFNFINSGFNLRPMDLTAAIGLNQIKRLKSMIRSRSKNRKMIIERIRNHSKWDDQFTFFEPNKNLEPSWFGLPLLLNKKYIKTKKNFLRYLNSSGVETRPILSGNFLNQESCKLYKFKFNNKDFRVSQEIEDRGFFIGLPTQILDKKKLNKITNLLLNVNNF